MSQSNYAKGVLAASITALLWGFLPIVLKVSLSGLSPIEVSWLRFAVAFILQLTYVTIKKPQHLSIFKKPPALILLASCFLGFNYIGLITGVEKTTPAIAEVFIQSGAIFLAIVGFIFFKEKASVRQIVGLIIVISGLGIFYWEQILVLAENVNRYKIGVGFTLFGGIMWTSYAIIQKQLVRRHDPLALNLILFGLPALLFLPFVDFKAIGALSPGMWGVLVFLGANTLIAYGGIAYALKFLEANKVSVIVTLNPIITFSTLAILMALEVSWVVHEHFTLISILGALMVVAGAVMTILKNRT